MAEEIVVADEQHMLDKINDLPNQFEKAWTSLWTKSLDLNSDDISRVLICGMGGSGIAGALAKDLLIDSSVPIETWADYKLPGWVDQKTLVIAVSYSGDTEETVDAVKAAITKEAKIIVISKGGKLGEIAKTAQVTQVTIDYDSSPREALGHLYGSVLTILAKLKIASLAEEAYMKALKELQQIVAGKMFLAKAQELVVSINNKVPLVVTQKPLTAVGRRWVNQFNENSKTFAAGAELPEMCHNTIVGLDFAIPEKLHVLLLESGYAFSRNAAREKIIQKVFTKKEIAFTPLSVRSGSVLAEQWLFIYFGDLLSYYLAGVNGVDPSPINSIKYLKEELEKA